MTRNLTSFCSCAGERSRCRQVQAEPSEQRDRGRLGDLRTARTKRLIIDLRTGHQLDVPIGIDEGTGQIEVRDVYLPPLVARKVPYRQGLPAAIPAGRLKHGGSASSSEIPQNIRGSHAAAQDHADVGHILSGNIYYEDVARASQDRYRRVLNVGNVDHGLCADGGKVVAEVMFVKVSFAVKPAA